MLKHNAAVYTINNNIAHLQTGSNESLLIAFFAFLQKGADMVTSTFNELLHQFTQKIVPNMESACNSVNEEEESGLLIIYNNRFFTKTASHLEQRMPMDRTPADPYGPGAIVPYI